MEGHSSMRPYILVYNVEAFKSYLDSLTADQVAGLIGSGYFVLAACNIKKEKHQTAGVTDWSDNDDYHYE